MILTPRRVEILKALAFYPHAYPISLRELGAASGLSSTNTVAHHLSYLVRAGMVRRGPKDAPRTLTLAPHVAVSRNGEVARIVPIRRCDRCDLTLPTDHHCEDDLHISMDWSRSCGG